MGSAIDRFPNLRGARFGGGGCVLVSPFQGFGPVLAIFQGCCPGLYYYCLSGRPNAQPNAQTSPPCSTRRTGHREERKLLPLLTAAAPGPDKRFPKIFCPVLAFCG